MSAEYYYRRHLGAKDLLPAIGVGVAAGLAGFYIVQLLIQRTPLVPQGELPRAPTTPPKRTSHHEWRGVAGRTREALDMRGDK